MAREELGAIVVGTGFGVLTHLRHSLGVDLAPYTRLFGTLSNRIRGVEEAADPAAATFEDGVAIQAVLDTIRRSSPSSAGWR